MSMADVLTGGSFCLNMTMEEVMRRIDRQIQVPILLQFQNFLERTKKANKPRERAFLAGLLRDIFYLVFLIGHEIATDTTTKGIDDELPQDTNLIANFLNEILDECYRLLASPGLIPSSTLRKAFLNKVASLCPIIASICEIEKQNRSSLWHVLNRDLNFLDLLGPDYTQNDRVKLRSLIPKNIPVFHPERRDAKNPWNNWLDNSANPATGWIAIQQKIPRIGDVLNRKKVYDYNALEAYIGQDELVTRDPENEFSQIPVVGSDFQHMTWSGFTTIPRYSVGFRVGTRKSTSTDGVVTLEHLNKAIMGIKIWETDVFFLRHSAMVHPAVLPVMARARRRLNSNVPFFRYAMAYRL